MTLHPLPSPPPDSGGALGALRRRDELLALLYWLHADQLNQAPSAADLAVFSASPESLDHDLQDLALGGLIRREPSGATGDGEPRVRLTPIGLDEAKRRFEEDFAPVPDGVAGNAHEVMVGVCGPNAKCVREGSHGECQEPVLPQRDAIAE